jgi:hypothetical protein
VGTTNRPIPAPRLAGLGTDGRSVLAALFLAVFALVGCSSIPRHNDERLPAELSRTLGAPRSDFRWVAAVDWSQHDGWWWPGMGEDFLHGMLSLSRTGVLTDDALIIARSGDFTVSYRVVQRIALDEIERVTLLENATVVLKRRGSGELRDYVRVMRSDPWLNDLFGGPSPELAQTLFGLLRARVPLAQSRWRPELPAQDLGRTVALLTPKAAPLVSFPPPPGSADKGAVQGTGTVAKELLQAGTGLGTLSPPAGLPFGIAALIVQGAGSFAGAVQGTVRENSEPEARAARARLDALQQASLPSAETSAVANRILLEALSSRIGAVEAANLPDDHRSLLVAVQEAETGRLDLASARAALAEDGFASIWQLQVTNIDLRVTTAGAEGSVANPQVALRIRARLHKARAGAGPDGAHDANTTELEETGEALPLSVWSLDEGKRLHEEFGAACERLATRLVEGAMADSAWLVPPH